MDGLVDGDRARLRAPEGKMCQRECCVCDKENCEEREEEDRMPNLKYAVCFWSTITKEWKLDAFFLWDTEQEAVEDAAIQERKSSPPVKHSVCEVLLPDPISEPQPPFKKGSIGETFLGSAF